MEMDHLNTSDYGINVSSWHLNLMNTTINTPRASSCLESKFIIHTLFAGLVCLIGFIGNSVSLFILAKDKQSPVATYLLQALSLADNVFLGLWFLHYSLRFFFKYTQIEGHLHVSWVYTRVYTFPMLFAAQTATIWLTVLIAVSRYILICIPYRANQLVNMPKTKKSVLVVVIFSIAYNIPRYFELYIIPVKIGNETAHPVVPTWLRSSELYNIIYFDILYYIFSFVLPLLILSVLNTRLTLAYRKIQARRARMNLRTDQDNNITLVMIIVVLVFMLCQAPARIVQIAWKYNYGNCNWKFLLTELSNFLEVFNSSSNFFIYSACRKQFRISLRETFCRTYQPISGTQKPLLENNHNIARNNCSPVTKTNETTC